MEKKLIQYPVEITIKTFFRNNPDLNAPLCAIFDEFSITAKMSDRFSSQGAFIAVTITATYPSEETLQDVCNRISFIPGFMMLV